MASSDPRVFFWRHGPFKGHFTEHCVAAFMEAPDKWGVERMGSTGYRTADRKGMAPCPECVDRFRAARLSGVQAGANRR